MKALTRTKIEDTRKIIKLFKELDPNATITSLDIFLLIATNKTIPMTELLTRSKVSKSNLSLVVAVLASYGRGNKIGLGLITVTEDLNDRRYKILTLTSLGEDIANNIESVLAGDQVSGGVL